MRMSEIRPLAKHALTTLGRSVLFANYGLSSDMGHSAEVLFTFIILCRYHK